MLSNRSPAEDYGEKLEAAADARSEAMKAERYAKRVFAECILRAEGKSAAEREANARLHPAYIKAEDQWLDLETAANITKAKADASAIAFEEWRTLRADARSLTK